jgi:hypothetical protein
MKKNSFYLYTSFFSVILTMNGADTPRIKENTFNLSDILRSLTLSQDSSHQAHFISFNQEKCVSEFPHSLHINTFFTEEYSLNNINSIQDKQMRESLTEDAKIGPLICLDLYGKLQKDIYGTLEYLKILKKKKLTKTELFKLHKKIEYLILKMYFPLTKIFERSIFATKKDVFQYAFYRSFNNAFFNLLKETEYINTENIIHLLPLECFYGIREYSLGFLKKDTGYLPCFINLERNLSVYRINEETLVLGHNKQFLEKSGFLVFEQRQINTINEKSDAFTIKFVQGCHAKEPFHTKNILNNVFITEKESSFWEMMDIKDTDDLRTRIGFFTLPTTIEEKSISTIDLIELFEDLMATGETIKESTLTLINQSLTEHLAHLFYDDKETQKALDDVQKMALTYAPAEPPFSSSFSSSSSSSSSSSTLSTPLDTSLQERILYKLSQVKKICTEKILSDYEKSIISEQEARKAGVIQGTTAGAKKQSKTKGSSQSKKGKGKQEQKQHPVKVTSEMKRSKALELLQAHQEKSKIKLRHMIQIINAMIKEQGLDEAHVRINGSHCNFDLGSGTQSASFVRPHGNKDGISINVANDFFKVLMNTMQQLDPATRKAMEK